MEPKSQNNKKKKLPAGVFRQKRHAKSFAKKRKKTNVLFSLHFTVCIPFSVQPSSMLVDNVTPARIAKG